jgi:ATP/maltotriose-dependent transcriptional regulator MalT
MSCSIALTEHERQVMQLVCEGRSNEEIGRLLTLSDDTVKLHVHSIYRKLTIHNRMTLVAMAAKLSPNASEGRDQAA